MKQPNRSGWLAALAMVVTIIFGLASMAQAQTSTPLQDPAYQVFAFNNLGMHCYDGDFSVFSLLPPFNVINSQVIQKQLRKPVILDSTAAKVIYQSAYSDRHVYDSNGNLIFVDHNSINTTSAGKTNFWDFVDPLFNIWFGPSYGLQPVVGILGFQMPGLANVPQIFAF